MHRAKSNGFIGSIPACAGEPALSGPHGCRPRVYPRVCGGTIPMPLSSPWVYGLSPRVRGNPTYTINITGTQGSIPACAGEPHRNCRPSNRKWVYPRVCGGTFPIETVERLFKGLSPRVRGNPCLGHCRSACQRSIPACAGEPAEKRTNRHTNRVYPRVCGGTAGWWGARLTGWGLSPRVRGNRPCFAHPMLDLGSIPACAGEPNRSENRVFAERVYPRVCGGT